MTYIPLEKLQNDVVACFDRQVNPYAMLKSRKYEVPVQVCKTLSAILQQTKYHVKTALGVSETSFSSTPNYPHDGLCQGSSNAGPTWLFESTPMMETVEKSCTCLDITSPDYSLPYTIHIIGLVDDIRQYANDWKEDSEKKNIYDNLQTVASSWKKIMHISDGALELASAHGI